MGTENGDPQAVLIVDDHPLFRKGVTQLLELTPEFQLAGEAATGEEAMNKACLIKPDIVLLDLDLGEISGIDVLKELKAAGLDCQIIMLTVSDQEEDVVGAIRAGADGYLLKDMEPEEFIANLQAAARGKLVLGNKVAAVLAHALRKENKPSNPSEAGLTTQERKILRLIAKGKTNKNIARELDIMESTVKVHVKHLLKKIHVRSRVEAAIWAIEQKRL